MAREGQTDSAGENYTKSSFIVRKLSLCPSVYPHTHPSYLPTYISVLPSIHPSNHPPIHLSIHPSIHPSNHLSSIYLSSVCLSIYLFIYLFIYKSLPHVTFKMYVFSLTQCVIPTTNFYERSLCRFYLSHSWLKVFIRKYSYRDSRLGRDTDIEQTYYKHQRLTAFSLRQLYHSRCHFRQTQRSCT